MARSDDRTSQARLSVVADVRTYAAPPNFVAMPKAGEVMIGVLGLGIQPVFLGVPTSGLPCVAFPSPDLLLVFPVFDTETLAIPASVRPFQFWTQGIAIGPSPGLASDVYRVSAQ